MTGSSVTSRTAAGRRAAAVARGPSRPGREVFAVADELTCYYDRPAEPANVHVEARVAGCLDQVALRAAVRAVLDAEHGLRVRKIGTGWWRHFYWESVAADGRLADPVSVESFRDDDELAGLRSDLISRSPALDDAPPLSLLLAVGEAGDVLILNAHHARFDGLACLRLLRAVAAEYTRLAGGQAAVADPGEAAGRPGRAGGPAEAAGQAAQARARGGRVTRIAALGEPSRPASAQDGYGLHQVTVDGLAAASALRSTGGTVNDLLIAAMISTVSGWNTAQGARTGLVKITMPVGDRAQLGPAGEWANRSRLTSVTAQAHVQAQGRPSADDLLADVAAQTRYAKQHPGPQVGLVSRALAWAPLPTGVKRLAVRAAMGCAGGFLADTCLVSNLGVIEPFAFGSAPMTSVWFSTSAHMPRGLSLGAVTCDDGLRLTFRYRRALFTAAAAASFAQQYTAALDRLAGRSLATGGGVT